MRYLVTVPVLCLCSVALAQSSASYQVEEFTLNAGGRPDGGLILSSASYQVSLDAVGDAPTAPPLHGNGVSMNVGFPHRYPWPGEVRQLVVLEDKTTLAWGTERSAGTYRIYGADLEVLPAEYGVCLLRDIAVPYAQIDELPDAGRASFYLVTATNSLLEEGPLGYAGAGFSRPAPAGCP